MKKALTLLLTLCLIVSVCALPVSAAVSIPFNSTNIEILDAVQGKIRVSGNLVNDMGSVLENRYVTILALNGLDAPISNYSVPGAVVAIATTTASADTVGKFSATFTFVAENPTSLTFYALYDGYTSAGVNFTIEGTASAATLVKQIQAGNIAQDVIMDKIKEHGQIGVDLTRFSQSEALFEYRVYTNRLDIDVTGTNAQILESFYALVDKVETEAAFVKEFNNTTYATTFITLMRNNAASMKGISFAAYDALSDAGKQYVQDQFVNKVVTLHQDFANADEIKVAFDTAVANAPTDNGLGGAGGAGGAGGGAPAPNDREWSGEMEDNSANTATTVAFYDLGSVSWAKEAIEALSLKGIVAGTSQGYFEPNGLVTREQFAKMIILASGKYNSLAVNEFTDIPAGDWSATYVASAKAAGFINGVGEGKFGYGRSITREDMAVMIYNVMKANGVTFDANKTDFADYSEISDYAKEAVSALAAKGIINGMGDNTFAPKATATRAQAALLVYAITKEVA